LGCAKGLGGAKRGSFRRNGHAHSTNPKAALQGANSLNEEQAKVRIEAKGYLKISGLRKDDRGIWRGKATMKDGRPVTVILDLEGNIYSEIKP
jgi:hypothetical protein